MLDVVIIAFLALCAILGLITGFVWQVLQLLSVVGCIWVAVAYSADVVRFLHQMHISLGPWGGGFFVPLGVFVLCLMACYLAEYLFRKPIDALKPRKTDRLAGAFFGIVKGALLTGMVFLLAARSLPQHGVPHRALAQSVMARGTALAVHRVGLVAGRFLPAWCDESIRSYLGREFTWPVAPDPDGEAAAGADRTGQDTG